MRLLRSLIIAFSMYSRIPTPHTEWKEADMKYVMACFPIVGAVIALIQYAAYTVAAKLGLNVFFTASIAVCIPLILTGGIHMDGFMDMSDALSSYKSKEERLEILKDPHIGAFAVIKAMVLMILYFGAVFDIISLGEKPVFLLLCLSYFGSRILCAAFAVCGRSAKKDGMLYTFVNSSEKGLVMAILVTEMLVFIILAVLISPVIGAIMILAMALSYLVCAWIAYKAIGGLTGDAAGWMLCISECTAAVAVTLAGHLLRLI